MWRCMGALGLLCLLICGCKNPLMRAQMAEDTEKERDLDIPMIKNVSIVDNVGPMKVQGVGLVTGLAGTGHCPAGYYRTLLEQYLLKHIGSPGGEIHEGPQLKVKHLLEDPNNALVIVTGYIPSGARHGDRFDVEVTLPPESKASSLAGGYLELSRLRIYMAKADLSERHAGSSEMVGGQIFGQAKGPLVVGYGRNTDRHEQRAGRVWQGGISRTERPYVLVMKKDKSIRESSQIAERINFMYQEDPRTRALLSAEQQRYFALLGDVADQLNQKTKAGGLSQTDMARPINKKAINLRVPFAYRYNHERYLLVAGLTPLGAGDKNLHRYQQRLKKMLLDPRDTMRAAVRLEALGRDSIPALKEGLESEHPFVRFASAEALAYLGSTYGVDTLTQLAQQHTTFGYHACLALANLGETICREKLGELLGSEEPAVRTAAFHALALLDDTDPRLGGYNMNDVFWLYKMPQSPAPMIYFSANKRAQVLLFGRNITLLPETRIMVGIGNNFTVVSDKQGGKCQVTRFGTQAEKHLTCSDRIDDILVAMTSLGASYPDIIDFLRRAHDVRKINCPVMTWTSPEIAFETLVDTGRNLKSQ